MMSWKTPGAALRTLLVLCAAALLLSACGFKLRSASGNYNLPFNKLYIGLPASSPLAIDLKRHIRVAGTTELVTDIRQADGILEVVGDPDKTRGKSILSLNSNGRVREYLLTYTITFRMRDNQGHELLAPSTISLNRPMSFDETQLLAKESEEAGLYRDMQTDLVNQMIRRMAAVKPVVTMSTPAIALPAAAPLPQPDDGLPTQVPLSQPAAPVITPVNPPSSHN
jgi:LPS-assembly lipoprotein